MQTNSVNNSVVVDTRVCGYKMRFDDLVVSPNYYRFEIEALQVAEPTTPVEITVNSDGGDLATGIEMVNEIIKCKAPVKGVLRSNCHSCGSIIFLACDSHEVGVASEMLLHSGSGGVGGTPAQAEARAKSYKRQVRALFETVYKGFITPEELDLMIEHDKEYIFSSEEIVERLERMYEYRDNCKNDALKEVFDKQHEESEKYESLLINKLVEDGTISQEEADVVNKVNKALDLLDKEQGESLYSGMEQTKECITAEEAMEEGLLASSFHS